MTLAWLRIRAGENRNSEAALDLEIDLKCYNLKVDGDYSSLWTVWVKRRAKPWWVKRSAKLACRFRSNIPHALLSICLCVGRLRSVSNENSG